MLPDTATYVYAGSTVPSLQSLADDGVGGILSWQMLLAFAIIGILPLAIKKAVTRNSDVNIPGTINTTSEKP